MFFPRILRLQAAGLFYEWEKWNLPSASKCTKVNERREMPFRLSLKNLSSTFVLLIAGYFLSLVAFIAEKLIRFQYRALGDTGPILNTVPCCTLALKTSIFLEKSSTYAVYVYSPYVVNDRNS